MSGDGPRSEEFLIDTALARRLLAAQFPQWAELPLEPVEVSGMDNMTYRLGADMSVRLPRFARWAGQVEREHRWLPRLAPQLPLAVSQPLAKGVPGEDYPYPWSVYRWLDGATPSIGDIAQPRRAAAELAAFVTALWRIDPTGGPAPEWSNAFRGVPLGDSADSIAVEARVRPKIAALAGLADTDAITAVWEASLAAPAWDGPPVWIHGDLAPGNLLAVDGRLSAVIDFGTVAVGDPACDLMVAWTFLPAGAREVFRAELSVDEATWVRGRGWGLACTLPTPDDLTAPDPARAARARHVIDDLIADHARDGVPGLV
jgi:aminoglycoside phosphotransferase (APT) family kinase protein